MPLNAKQTDLNLEMQEVVAGNDASTEQQTLTTTLISGENKKPGYSKNCQAIGGCGILVALIGGIVVLILYAGRCGTVVLQGGTPGVTFRLTGPGQWSNSSLAYRESIHTVFPSSATAWDKHKFTITAEANGTAQSPAYDAACFNDADCRLKFNGNYNNKDGEIGFNHEDDYNPDDSSSRCTRVVVLKGYEGASDAFQSMLSNNIFGEQQSNTKHLRGTTVEAEKEEPAQQENLRV